MHCLAITDLAYKYPPHLLLRLMDSSSSSNIGMLSYAPADRRWKPAVEVAPAPPNCPRCDSSNTKFCYYNNYSLSQPRYFCKGCRRYWTKGGSLRNVPVGGRCRKSRRGKSGHLSAPLAAARRSPPHAARRPDLMLNDAYTTAADDTEIHRPAAAIDLEVLYAKYLNRADPPGPPASTPEIAAATTSSESSCGQIPLQFPTQQLPLECQSAVAHPPSMEETLAMSQINDMLYNFSVDWSSSLAPLPPPATEPEDKQASSLFDCPKDSISINYEEFESFPVLTTCMQQHQQGSMLEDEWSSLDYSTLEAFYRC